MKRIIALMAALAVLFTLGCSVEDPDGEGAEVVGNDASSQDGSKKDSKKSKAGTRDNPLPVGTAVKVGQWEVAVQSVNKNAESAVMKANEFNEIPKGRQAVMFKVKATYRGEDSGDPLIDLGWAIVTKSGNTVDGANEKSYCGVIPNPLDEQGETFTDAKVKGNVCLAVPKKNVNGATIQVEDSFSFEDSDRTYFAIK